MQKRLDSSLGSLRAALLILALLLSACGFSQVSHLARAENFRADKKYTEAIEEYQAYIDQRQKEKNTNPDLNPNFYYLLIGDCYLGIDRPQDAKKAYISAKEQSVSPSIVASKFRSLAAYFEDRGEYSQAIEILTEFRPLDPMLFDIDIDRNHKELISAEDKLHPTSPN